MTSTKHEKPLLLIVEDEPAQLRRLVRIFEPSYTVLAASTGEDAIGLYRHHYDSIVAMILDIRLPDKSAFELLSTFEKICFTGVPPTVIQTAFDETEWIQTMLGEYRALHYLVKPFTEEAILAAVQNVLESDPFVFKWEQVKERLDIMSGLSQLRGNLYHTVSLMPEPEKDAWMPQIMDLFHLYGEESLFSSSTHFKLKTTLSPVFDLAQKLLGVGLPAAPTFKIGLLPQGIPMTQVLEATPDTDPDLLIPNPHFEIVQLNTLYEDPGCDFILLDLDHSETHYGDIQAFCQNNLSPKKAYLIVITQHKNHALLEKAIQHGATFGFLEASTASHHIKNSLIKFANRRYEIFALETILKS